MCKKEIATRTIASLETDIAMIYEELRHTPMNCNVKRARLRQSIIYAEETIADLKTEMM